MQWMPDSLGVLPAAWDWLAGVGALFALIVWRAARWRQGRMPLEAACRRCGYFVTGLPGVVCPECGSDLRLVGVIPPRRARPTPAWVHLIVLALLTPMPAVVTWRWVRPILPLEMVASTVVTLQGPASGQYLEIRVEGFGRRWAWTSAQAAAPTIPLTEIHVQLARRNARRFHYLIDLDQGDGGRAIRSVDLVDRRTYDAPHVHRPRDVTGDALLMWLNTDPWYDVADRRLQKEMGQLARLLQGFMRDGTVAFSDVSWMATSSKPARPQLSMPLWMPGTWLGLWLLVAGVIAARIVRCPTAPDTRTASALDGEGCRADLSGDARHAPMCASTDVL